MAKVDPRQTTTTTPAGPVRTESGTRAAVRLAPVTPTLASQAAVNDMRNEMPTQQLDVEELRAMALRCASDVDADDSVFARAREPAPEQPGAEESAASRPRLELVFGDDADPVAPRAVDLRDDEVDALTRPRRVARIVLAVVLVAMTLAAIAAFKAYLLVS